MNEYPSHTHEAVALLSRLITIPSISRAEKEAADALQAYLEKCGLAPRRVANNVWCTDPLYDKSRLTVLLNAHIDTVKPAASWTKKPFEATLEDGKLYGLGSNDCGGGLVSLLQAYRIMLDKPRCYNLIYLASAEEEVSGKDGISLALPCLPPISVAIVGEPTGMKPAIAEKGLMVLDVIAHGKAGHAARNEGVNALYEALDDMLWIRDYRFKKTSPLLGPVKMTLTVINAGTQHNVVPDCCKMLVDVRTNEHYTNEEVYDIIKANVKSEVHAHSFKLHSSHIPTDHPLVKRCVELGLKPYGSPTLSDQALMPWPSFKLGPGESARSHSANEFICLSEMRDAFSTYQKLLQP